MNDKVYKDKVKNFIIDNFLYGESINLDENGNLVETGIIDSTGILELINFLEKNFDIEINDEEIIPENFGTIRNIVLFLQKKVDQNKS